MADAIDSGICSLIGLGRSVVLQPDLPETVLLNPSVSDDEALAVPHIVKGQWFANMIPVKVVGSGLAIQFFYHNMRRLGHGLKSDPDASSKAFFRVITCCSRPLSKSRGMLHEQNTHLSPQTGVISPSLPLPMSGNTNSEMC